MKMSRRTFMATGAALPFAASSMTTPSPVQAEIAFQNAILSSVSDGNLILPGNLLFEGMPAEELDAILNAHGGVSSEQVRPPCNLALYQDGENVVLFDVGAGPDFMSSAGKILESLDALNLAPEDITNVIFTHAHPDHIWGLIDEFDDLLFYEATYMMGRKEWDYWWNPETVNTIGGARQTFAVGAKRRMEMIEDSIELFGDDEEILPGIASVASYGHTPGHMAFEVSDGSNNALIIGDAIGNDHVALARPDWPSGADQEKDAGIAARKMLIDRATNEQLRIVGFHLPDGGIGFVEAAKEGYRFIPEKA